MSEHVQQVIDTPEQDVQPQLSPEEALALAKQRAEDKLRTLDNPDFQALAERQLAEVDILENGEGYILEESLIAHNELHTQMETMDMMEEKYAGLNEWFEQFTAFITSGELSIWEFEQFLKVVDEKDRKIKRDFRKNWFPKNRSEFSLFSENYWIKITAEHQENHDTSSTEAYIQALDTYRNIDGVPELDQLTSMIEGLDQLEGAEARAQMERVYEYLVWPDGKGGELDTILAALEKKDRENAAAGKPTKHLQSFVRVTRDLSPDVSRRIDIFLQNNDTAIHTDPEIGDILREWVVRGGIPEGSTVQSDGVGEIVATTPEGDTVTLEVDGDRVTRSYSLAWSDFALWTEIQRADFSAPTTQYETVRQEVAPKIQGAEDALAFLENPLNFQLTLEDMQPTLIQLMGSALYNKLGLRTMTDKQQIIDAIQSELPALRDDLAKAKKEYKEAVKAAVEANRKRVEAADEAVKQTLRRIQALGFDHWDIDFLLAQMRSGFLVPQLAVSFEVWNVDLSTQNFWEPAGATASFDLFNEYLTRFVNKGLTGNPEGLNEQGELVGFSLADAIRNPDAQTKTEAEIKHIMKQGGIWSEATGFNKEQAIKNLTKPL